MNGYACPICGERAVRVLYRGGDLLYRTSDEVFDVAGCIGCGMARLEPQPRDLQLCYPAGYWFEGGAANVYRRIVLRDHARFVMQALGRSARAPGRSSRVLDAGSGGGLLAALLCERGIRAVALDIAPAAAQLSACGGVPAVAADFAQAPFADGAWDAIAMFHMIEHVPDPRAHLIEAHRILAADGRLIVAAPNFDSLQRRIFGTRWNGMDIPRHLHHFRVRDLQALLEQSGFRVKRTRYFSWRDSPAGVATTLAPGLDPMARAIRGRSGVVSTAGYALLTAVAVPFAALEALFLRGAMVMLDAVRV